ncbi:MAG: DUF3800 domain-containing protein [Pseudomonadota bacterium]
MYILYLDDSDSTGSSVVTIAGYVQHIADWESFEENANAVCQKYEVDCLHGIEFHNTRGCFKGWSYVDKRNFIDELYAKPNNLLGISHSIKKKGFGDIKKESRLLSQTSPYGAAFNTICGSMVINPLFGGEIQKEGVSFVVEAGHKNNAELGKMFSTLQTAEWTSGILKSIDFAQKGDCRAIQLADLNAFYSRRQAAKMANKTDLSPSEAGKMEEKMFSLIKSQCQHFQAIADYDGSAHAAQPLDGVGDIVELSKKNTTHMKNTTHIVSPVGRPSDP